jgi:hypothetical protein
MSILVIGSCASDELAKQMKHSAAKHGLAVHLYAVGGSMGSCHGGDIQGSWAIDVMKSVNATHILSVDPPDVLLLADEPEIMEKFRTFNKGMVVSAENNCVAPVAGVREFMESIPGRHAFVNIGCWLGERQYAIEVMQKSIDLYRNKPLDPTFNLDSPGAWFMYGMMQGTLDFALDRESVLFQSANGWSRADIEVREGRVYNGATGTWPIAVHYNGTAGDKYAPFYEMSRRLYGV